MQAMMTNDELVQAIEVADKRVHQCGTGSPRYDPLLSHLKDLLAEQKRRAETRELVFAPSGPIFVQPWTVQPTWAPTQPWAPPFTVTC